MVLPARHRVQLLPRRPTHVAGDDHAGGAVVGIGAPAFADGEAVGVAEAEGPHLRLVGVGVAVVVGVRREPPPRLGVDAEDLAGEALEAERAEGADVLAEGEAAGPEAVRVVAAGVDVVEAGAVAGADEEVAVGAEGDGADGGGVVAARDALRHRLADEHAAGAQVGAVGVARQRVVARQPPEGVEALVVAGAVAVDGVEEEDAAAVVDGEAEEAAVPVVEHLGLDVDERVRQPHAVLDHPHDAALLGDEHPPVGREGDRDGGVEGDAPYGVLDVEAGGERGGGGRRVAPGELAAEELPLGGGREGDREGQQEEGEDAGETHGRNGRTGGCRAAVNGRAVSFPVSFSTLRRQDETTGIGGRIPDGPRLGSVPPSLAPDPPPPPHGLHDGPSTEGDGALGHAHVVDGAVPHRCGKIGAAREPPHGEGRGPARSAA